MHISKYIHSFPLSRFIFCLCPFITFAWKVLSKEAIVVMADNSEKIPISSAPVAAHGNDKEVITEKDIEKDNIIQYRWANSERFA